MMNVGSLIYSRAAGYLPASPGETKRRNLSVKRHLQQVTSASSGGGGNCTPRRDFASACSNCDYGCWLDGWPEMGREKEALRELVGNWHVLTSTVREKIMKLVRGG
jgi:hypothetical protein